MGALFVGIDIGTSGCRVAIIDENERVVARSSASLPQSTVRNGHLTQQPINWWRCCVQVLTEALNHVDKNKVEALAIDGTSGSILLTDASGTIHSDGYMYNDNHNSAQAALIDKYAPRESGAHGCSSGLAKCLSLIKNKRTPNNLICLNQADWIAGNFVNRFNFSDENNALKMGYDLLQRHWPSWLTEVISTKYLPNEVYAPGDLVGTIDKSVAKQFGLPTNTKIIAGTTDSIAGFIATGATKPGEAVSSLGSTLAVKLINESAIFSPDHGVYSHRLGKLWLVGGASNTGGAVLKHFFNQKQLDHMTVSINPNRLTNLNYYPLLNPGERFPVNDPRMVPVLTPRPEDDTIFFQAMLEGIARIEKQSYDKLAELGANYPHKIISMGGGSKNIPWQTIREKFCNVTITTSVQNEAAYGSALLAKQIPSN